MPLVPVLMGVEWEMDEVNPYVPTAAAMVSAIACIMAVLLLAPTVTATVAIILVTVMTTTASVSPPTVAASLWMASAAVVTVASAGAVAWVVVTSAGDESPGLDLMNTAFSNEPGAAGMPYVWTSIPFSDELPDSGEFHRVLGTPQMSENRDMFELME